MSQRRSLVVLFALGLAVTLSSPTQAAAPAHERVQQHEPGAARAGTDEPVRITSRIVRRRGEGLFLVGGVTPAAGPVYVQRATTCDRATKTCDFTFYRKVLLDGGRYETKVAVPPTLRGFVWRAKVGTEVSASWLTCTKTRQQRAQDRRCKVPA